MYNGGTGIVPGFLEWKEFEMFGLSPLTPAYGRDYQTKDEVVKALLLDGKDFIAANGQYCSIRDLERLGIEEISVRYAKLRKVAVITLIPIVD